MTKKRKKRAREIQARTGVSYQGAINQLNKNAPPPEPNEWEKETAAFDADIQEILGPPTWGPSDTPPPPAEPPALDLPFAVKRGPYSGTVVEPDEYKQLLAEQREHAVKVKFVKQPATGKRDDSLGCIPWDPEPLSPYHIRGISLQNIFWRPLDSLQPLEGMLFWREGSWSNNSELSQKSYGEIVDSISACMKTLREGHAVIVVTSPPDEKLVVDVQIYDCPIAIVRKKRWYEQPVWLRQGLATYRGQAYRERVQRANTR